MSDLNPAGSCVRLNDEIARRYGNPDAFIHRVVISLWSKMISRRQLALRSGLCYTHVLKVLGGSVRPQLETMLVLDEALEQLVNDWEEENV